MTIFRSLKSQKNIEIIVLSSLDSLCDATSKGLIEVIREN